MLHPVIPHFTKKSLKFLNEDEIQWTSIDYPLLNCKINNFEPLVTRIDDSHINQLLEN